MPQNLQVAHQGWQTGAVANTLMDFSGNCLCLAEQTAVSLSGAGSLAGPTQRTQQRSMLHTAMMTGMHA